MTVSASWLPLREHAAGIVGQVAASLPLLLVTIWIARAETLEGAGRFTVVVGVSAAAYSTALWGLRSAVVLDRFREFTPAEYLQARVASLLLAGAVTVAGGLWMGVSVLLLLLIIVLRTTDGLVDLGLSFTQVRIGTEAALRLYALVHLGKLMLVTVPLGGAYLFNLSGTEPGLLLAATIALLGVCGAGARSDFFGGGEGDFGRRPASRVLAVFGRSKWFALAVVSCAILTSTPRIIVPGLYQGDLLGVVGVSLSVGTFFGMVFFTSWLRILPRFEASPRRSTVLRSYLLEWLGVGVLLAAAARTILPPVVSVVFDFPDADFTATSSAVLLAGVAFAGGMTLANLYKVTPWPWLESVTYLLPIVVLGATMQLLSWPGSMPSLLTLAGGILLLCSVPPVLRLAET